jgi:hypothetical protein
MFGLEQQDSHHLSRSVRLEILNRLVTRQKILRINVLVNRNHCH